MISPDRESQDNAKPQQNPFQRLFADLPEDPNLRLNALAEVNHSFRQALAGQLRPVVRALLQETPPQDDKGRRELAHRLNHVLHDANLAIVDPDTSQPASVVAHSWRLRLQSRTTGSGKRSCSRNTKSLPPLELTECARQEPFLRWRERARDNNPPSDEKIR